MSKALRHPKPHADWSTRAFWEGAARGELVLQRCPSCGAVQHKPRPFCGSCFHDRVEHFVASGRGVVHTYTVTHQNQAPGFREACPYVFAIVELEEGPRLVTNVVGCEPGAVEIGLPVEVEFAATEGPYPVPRFRPVAG